MSIILPQPDGLYLLIQATLTQLLEDETLAIFADGMLRAALIETCHLQSATCHLSLAEALYSSGSETYPLLTALLVLDAEVHTLADEKKRVLPLSGFLSYRASLPPDKFPLEALRLPPLNPGGRYIFSVADSPTFVAVRLDLHEKLRVAGHVRLALSNPTHPPLRLHTLEDRLERRVMNEALIDEVMTVEGKALTALTEILKQAIR